MMKQLIFILFAVLLATNVAQAQNPQSVRGVQCGVEREVSAQALTESTYKRLERAGSFGSSIDGVNLQKTRTRL